MKIRATSRNILFSLASLFTVVLILEILLRLTHLFGARISSSEPDPVLGSRATRGHEYYYNMENDHPITGKINRFGWRDTEWTLAKPKGTYRIAVLGDSYVAALQVELKATFCTLTEGLLNKELGVKVDLMNFSRSGMTQSEEFLVLKNEVLKFSPDMVILFFLPANDIDDINRQTTNDTLRPFFEISKNGELVLDTSFSQSYQYKIKALINPIKQHSALISLIAQRLRILKQSLKERRVPSSEANEKKIGPLLSLCTAHPDPLFLQNYHLNKVLIRAMAGYCKIRKIKFMLVCIDFMYKSEKEAEYVSIDPTFKADFFEEDLRRYADSLDIEYVGLREPFNQFYEEQKMSLHWIHWNYTGHRLVAEVLSQKLISILK